MKTPEVSNQDGDFVEIPLRDDDKVAKVRSIVDQTANRVYHAISNLAGHQPQLEALQDQTGLLQAGCAKFTRDTAKHVTKNEREKHIVYALLFAFCGIALAIPTILFSIGVGAIGVGYNGFQAYRLKPSNYKYE